MDGKIITLLEKYQNNKDYRVLDKVIVDILGDNNE